MPCTPNTPIVPWMEFTNRSKWEKALPLAKRSIWKKETLLDVADDSARSIFLIWSGVVKVQATSREGVQRALWLMGPGSILGEAAMFAHFPLSNYVHQSYAIEDCVVYEFSKEAVTQKILVRYPDLSEALLSSLATKSYILSTQLEEGIFLSVTQRLGRFIYGLCLVRNSTRLPFSHAVIAELLGLHRVTVSNAIRVLKHARLLEDCPPSIVVSDMDALATYLAVENKHLSWPDELPASIPNP